MTLIIFILFLLTADVFVNIQAKQCNLVEDKSPSLQLFRHLFCEYETSERPTKDTKNTTVVQLVLIPKIIQFEDFYNNLLIHAWVYITWKDEYLQWNASDYNEIDLIWVQSSRIWTPDLAVENSGSADSVQMGVPLTNCMLSSKGHIVCVPPVLFSTKCNADYTYWPFDRQNCSIELSSWSYNSNELSFDGDEFHVFMGHYVPNGEWNIISYNTSHSHKKSKYMSYDKFPTIVTHFILQRAESQLWRVFGTPTLILAAMTLTILWLDPKSNERLMLGCVNFFCHFLCMRNLNWVVPQSNIVPNILIFYNNSIILAVLALILTCLFRRIVDTKDTPPPWISSAVSMILSSKIGQILLLSILDPKVSARIEEDADDNSNLVNNQTSKKSTWAYVTIILGWILFISYLLTYIIMFIILLYVPDIEK